MFLEGKTQSKLKVSSQSKDELENVLELAVPCTPRRFCIILSLDIMK